MSAILIKSTSKAQENFILSLAKMLKTPARILDEDEESDAFLIKLIDKGMKSGKASKKDVKKFFEKNGLRIH
jgi:hypothetical protein